MGLKGLRHPKLNPAIDSCKKIFVGLRFHSATRQMLPQILGSCNRIFLPAEDRATNSGPRPELS
jgi:hypothetical protein